MEHKLSIVMPCYNCADTLKQAVESIYQQTDLTASFEVILVNDASTDNTLEVIKNLQVKYKEIACFSHEVNLGGGAARNTGIKNATGDLIYCLDGDNFFAANSIQPMINYLIDNSLDGVAFYERRFFVRNNYSKYNKQINEITNRNVDLEDLFNNSNVIIDNFFFTKESWEKAGGYPEENNFDTQCFELRYLTAGNKLRFCPNSIFYHRQFMKKKSYFERVYDDGDFSRNFYLIYREMFHLFSDNTKTEILKYNIFINNSLAKNIKSYVLSLYQQSENNFFIDNYRKYLQPNSLEMFCNALNRDNLSIYDKMCLKINNKFTGNPVDLYNELFAIVKTNSCSLMYDYVRSTLHDLKVFDQKYVDRHFYEIVSSFIPKKQTFNKSFIKRIKEKLI